MSRFLLSRNIELTAEEMKQFRMVLIYNLYDDEGPISENEVDGWFQNIFYLEKELICILEIAKDKSGNITGASALLFSTYFGYEIFTLIMGLHPAGEINAIYN